MKCHKIIHITLIISSLFLLGCDNTNVVTSESPRIPFNEELALVFNEPIESLESHTIETETVTKSAEMAEWYDIEESKLSEESYSLTLY